VQGGADAGGESVTDASLADGLILIVTDSPVGLGEGVPRIMEYAPRADEVASRFRLPERRARKGGNQAQQEHRRT
jgi:hypothetical protein